MAPSRPAQKAARQPSEIWQARIPTDLARDLESDAELLGLSGRTDIVREALRLLHRHAEETRAAQQIADFYDGERAPLPESLVARRRR